MDGGGNVGGVEIEKGKASRGRRSWTKIEEDTLVQCLTTIVNDGWKAENGFKAGFQRELEKLMRKLLPGTDILATPHINYKIHVWKKEYDSSKAKGKGIKLSIIEEGRKRFAAQSATA
ncbi:hypothetical protein ACS0TY_034062 [Phlomoides rotata]